MKAAAARRCQFNHMLEALKMVFVCHEMISG